MRMMRLSPCRLARKRRCETAPSSFAVGGEVAREACRPARQGQAVVAGQSQAVVEKIGDLLGKAPVAAINRRRVKSLLVKPHGARESRRRRGLLLHWSPLVCVHTHGRLSLHGT